MCDRSAGKQVTHMNTFCHCGCHCSIPLPIADEIRDLEDHKKILQGRIEMIEKKIAGLKTVCDS